MASATKRRGLSQAQKDYRKKQRQEKLQRDKAVKKKLGVLKGKGLFDGDLRTLKVTRYHKNLVSTLADVISGKSKAVKIPPKAARTLPKADKQNRGSVRRKGNIAIVPIKNENERLAFNEKTGEISSYVKIYGDKYKRVLTPKQFHSVDDLPNPEKGQVLYYGLVSNQHGAIRFQSKEEFRKFLAEYKADERELMPHVEILIPVGKDDRHAAEKWTSHDAPLPKRRKDKRNTRKSKG